jgi:hypothetical protein
MIALSSKYKFLCFMACLVLAGCDFFKYGTGETSRVTPSEPTFGADVRLPQCDLRPAFMRPDERGAVQVQVYEGRPVEELNGARPLAFVSTLKVNTDGTKRSYHTDDPRGERIAINSILNAMRRSHRSYDKFERIRDKNWPSPETWTYLLEGVIEKNADTDKPCIDSDGYLISKTSDVVVPGGFNRVGDCDQSKWIDALSIPGLVVPKGQNQFYNRHARKRSPVFAVSMENPDHRSFGIIGDAGPEDELGEANVAMNRDLNGLPDSEIPSDYNDAKNRFQAPRSLIVIFPGQANKVHYPFDAAKAKRIAQNAFHAWGGERKLLACVDALE